MLHETRPFLILLAAGLCGCAARNASSDGPGESPLPLVWEPERLEVTVAGDGSSSLRGLFAVDDQVAWATGSGATVARTVDGGKNWEDVAPASIDGLDVRDAHALGPDVAWILTAGPGEASRILKTDDGGATWTEQHREMHPDSFLNGFAFFDATSAVAYGDPLPGVGFRILTTKDSGQNWIPLEPGPMPLPGGEASFAASGTGIGASRVLLFESAWLVTGANDGNARVLHTSSFSRNHSATLFVDFGSHWYTAETTLPASKPASGAFSIAFSPGAYVVVGGDYTQREKGGAHCASYSRNGQSWFAPDIGPRGQRAGVSALDSPSAFVATGQTGTDITTDAGRTWRAFSDEGFHCVHFAENGPALWFAGPGGRVGRLLPTRAN